ncbi:hypothetical protein SAMN05660690_1873 [Geodermatophilus telluris]|uniref:Uncharacterized protein n=1 Tax=Geodermatophilus telluris TaxID=1190417 RepID=A0A1G6MIB3_9ACTN|nr:hypothetical protein [Geodermatophilus telluris]SDC55272.1 hypothetical protein SAMN05660690_1873 [Geodermatophilus telluris]
MRVGTAAAVLAAAVLLLTGCSDVHLPAVEEVAGDFAAGDPAVRCQLLTRAAVESLEHEEPAGCATALQDLQLGTGGVESAQVWGTEAQVRLTDDTLFLTATTDGWRVAAAGCAHSDEDRYDCLVEGS